MTFTSPFAKSTSKPGHGSIVVEVLAPDAPVLKTVSYQYPLKLIAPEPLPPPDYVSLADTPRLVHTVYLLTYGGGIVAGDSIDLDVHLDKKTRLLLLTQGSTKIFKTEDAQIVSHQRMNVHLKDGAALVYLPDPVQPFAQTAFSQSQIYHLDGHGSLCVCDWVTSGRSARGENWDIFEYKSRNEVWDTESTGRKRLLLRDNLILDKHGQTDMHLSSRMDGFSVLARSSCGDQRSHHWQNSSWTSLRLFHALVVATGATPCSLSCLARSIGVLSGWTEKGRKVWFGALQMCETSCW